MKNILKISILILAMTAIWSCESDDEKTVAQGIEAPVLLTPNTAIALSQDAATIPAFTLVWNDSDYDVNTQVNYTIEIDKVGNEFNAPVTEQTKDRFFTWTVEELNKKATELGLAPGEEAAMELRVKSVLGSEGFDEMISTNTTILTITPYATDAPLLYIIGNFLTSSGYGNNWSPSEASPAIIGNGPGSKDYEGYVFITGPYHEMDTAPQFKILPTNVNFDGDWGNKEDVVGLSGALIQEDEANIKLADGGFYRFEATLDGDDSKWKATKTEWSLVGGATPLGWPADGTDGQSGNDHDMTYDADTKVWSITIDLDAGEFKFRANDAWSLNLGNGDEGLLAYDGGNFSVDAGGNYTITLDLSNPRAYTATVTKN